MPEENDFRRILREHLRATKAGKFGQFEYAWRNEHLPNNPFERPIRPGFGADFLMRIDIDDGTPDGRLWVPTDDLPLATDFTSESSGSTPGIQAQSFFAGKFSSFVDDESTDFTQSGPQPFGGTQTDPLSNVITLSEQSAPPGNIAPASLSSVSFTFTVVPVGTALPDDPVFRPSISPTRPLTVPVVLVEVLNNAASFNLEEFYFNGPAGFIFQGHTFFTPRETSAQATGTGTSLARWRLSKPL